MNKLDILKFCYNNNLYNVYADSLLNLENYGLPYTIGFIGNKPENIKKYADSLFKENNYQVNFCGELFKPESYYQNMKDIKFTNGYIWNNHAGVYNTNEDGNNWNSSLSLNGKCNYFLYRIKSEEYYRNENEDVYYPGWPLDENKCTTLNWYFVENKINPINEDYFVYSNANYTHTDTLTDIKDGITYTRKYTFGTINQDGISPFKAICLPELNYIQNITRPGESFIENPELLFNEIIPPYLQDGEDLLWENINNNYFWIFGNMLENKLYFLAEKYRQSYNEEEEPIYDPIFVEGKMGYSPIVNLKESFIRVGYGSLNDIHLPEYVMSWWTICDTEEDFKRKEVQNWLKKIPI